MTRYYVVALDDSMAEVFKGLLSRFVEVELRDLEAGLELEELIDAMDRTSGRVR